MTVRNHDEPNSAALFQRMIGEEVSPRCATFPDVQNGCELGGSLRVFVGRLTRRREVADLQCILHLFCCALKAPQ